VGCVLWYFGFFSHNSSSSAPTSGTSENNGSIHRAGSLGEVSKNIELSQEEQNMPVDPVFVTNGGFIEELSLGSRITALEGVTNFVANARACGLGVYVSGQLAVKVRSGVNNVAYAKTTNGFFDMMYSNGSPSEVVSMDSRGGRDALGMPTDVNEFTGDASSPHTDALATWANTNNYPFVPPNDKTDAAVARFLALQIPGFADRYLLESRDEIEIGGYKTPFMRYTYAATNCLKSFSNMNRDSVEVTLRVGGPDLMPGSNPNMPPTGVLLVNYEDGGVLWRKITTPSFNGWKSQ
jgi:hypothetical protein